MGYYKARCQLIPAFLSHLPHVCITLCALSFAPTPNPKLNYPNDKPNVLSSFPTPGSAAYVTVLPVPISPD